jgi:hypothetical protein
MKKLLNKLVDKGYGFWIIPVVGFCILLNVISFLLPETLFFETAYWIVVLLWGISITFWIIAFNQQIRR